METAEIYQACRQRLVELAADLGPAQTSAHLAATPPWTVLDGYRHLAGVCANVLDGTMEGAGTPDWTAAQIGGRAASSLDEVCSEWAGRAPDLDARVTAAKQAMSFIAFDTWTHEQDIRAAAGLAGERDEIATELAAIALETLGGRYAAVGGPAVLVDLGGQQAVLGNGEPSVTLRTTPYEWLRMVFGRRSRAQMEAADWSGDAGPVIDALHIFDLPVNDIID